MTLNAAQNAYMQARYPDRQLNDLPPEIRLFIGHLGDVDDPEPLPVAEEDELTDAQLFFLRDSRLSPKDIPNLTEAQRKEFEAWGDPIHRRRPAATAEVEAKEQSEEPTAFRPKTLNTDRLNAAGISPEHRLSVIRAWELLQTNPTAALGSGVSKRDIEWARMLTKQYID